MQISHRDRYVDPCDSIALIWQTWALLVKENDRVICSWKGYKRGIFVEINWYRNNITGSASRGKTLSLSTPILPFFGPQGFNITSTPLSSSPNEQWRKWLGILLLQRQCKGDQRGPFIRVNCYSQQYHGRFRFWTLEETDTWFVHSSFIVLQSKRFSAPAPSSQRRRRCSLPFIDWMKRLYRRTSLLEAPRYNPASSIFVASSVFCTELCATLAGRNIELWSPRSPGSLAATGTTSDFRGIA